MRTADLLSRRAIGFGVTNELSTMVPYDTPRRWSAALRGSGFDGISYRTRFDTGPTSRGRALFGPAGLARHRIVVRRSIDHEFRLRLTRDRLLKPPGPKGPGFRVDALSPADTAGRP